MGSEDNSASPAVPALWGGIGAVAVGWMQVALVASGDGPRPGIVALTALILGAVVAPGGVGVAAGLALGWGRFRSEGAALFAVVGAWGAIVALLVARWVLPPPPFVAAGGPLPVLAALALPGLLAWWVGRRRGAARVGRWGVLALVAAAGALLAARVPSLRGPPVPTGPNVLLVTLDALRAAPVDGRVPDMVAFDRVAAGGVRFERAFSQVAGTGPAHAGLLAGAAPWEIGVLLDGATVPAEHPVLPEALRRAGYATGAFVSAWGLDHALGFSRGFGTYDDDFGWVVGGRSVFAGQLLAAARGRDRLATERRGSETADRALRWLGRQHDPWFAWVHLGDPRPPWTAPPPYDQRYYAGLDARDPGARPVAEQLDLPPWLVPAVSGITDRDWLVAAWLGEVAFADAQLERLLDWLDASGQAEDTVVIVVGADGLSFGDRGVWLRPTVARSAVAVPLAVRWPERLPAGARVGEAVELTDLAPSIAAWTGIDAPPEWKGGPIQRLLDGGLAPRSGARTVALERRDGVVRVTAAIHHRAGTAEWRGTVSVTPEGSDPADFAVIGPILAERAAGLAEEVQRAGVRRPPLSARDRSLLERTGHDLGP